MLLIVLIFKMNMEKLCQFLAVEFRTIRYAAWTFKFDSVTLLQLSIIVYLIPSVAIFDVQPKIKPQYGTHITPGPFRKKISAASVPLHPQP